MSSLAAPDLVEAEANSAYRWLIDALRPECDAVIADTEDFGAVQGIGCRWGSGKGRTATYVETENLITGHSLNALIRDGVTRESVVARMLEHRPPNWSKAQ